MIIKDYILLDTGSFSGHNQIACIDIDIDGRPMLYTTKGCNDDIPFKVEGRFTREDSDPYVILVVSFEKKYTDKILERLEYVHNKAMMLGYTDLDKWKEYLISVAGAELNKRRL